VVHVRLRIGSQSYALAVADVRAVATAGELTPVPGAPACVLGVRVLHGRLLPVMDLAPLLGIAPGPVARVVVVPHGRRELGLAAAEVHDVAELPPGDAPPGSALLRDSVLAEGALVGVIDLPAALAALAREIAR
jgi:purine-binding chemotaxis protein CheW